MTVSAQNLTLNPTETPATSTSLKIGVLALQGAFLEHANMLRKLGALPVEVPAGRAGPAGRLIIPAAKAPPSASWPNNLA